jgi:hypothetical protein
VTAAPDLGTDLDGGPATVAGGMPYGVAAAAVAETLAAAQADRPAALSPSRLGACRRQSAYLLHRVPKSDDVDRDAADVGTVFHAGWASLTGRRGGLVTEEPVPLPGEAGRLGIVGTPDWVAYTPDRSAAVVGDLKTLKVSRFGRWVAEGPPADVWAQVDTYAAALADLHPDVLAWGVEVVGVCRETGAARAWHRPADLAAGLANADRLAALQVDLLAAPPDDAPRDGTGTGFPCGWCAWLSRCWPDPDDTAPPGDDEAALAAARAYQAASVAEATARAEKARARAVIGVGRDVTGPDIVARWSTSTRRIVDEAAVADALGEVPRRVSVVQRLDVTPRGGVTLLGGGSA